MKDIQTYRMTLFSVILLSGSATSADDNLTNNNPRSIESTNTSAFSEASIIADPSLFNMGLLPEPATYQQPSIAILNRYEWHLVRVDNLNGFLAHNDNSLASNSITPLNLDIRPNMLVFSHDCQVFKIPFSRDRDNDYPYTPYGVGASTNCEPKQKGNQQQISSDLKTTFTAGQRYHYISKDFGMEWLDTNMNRIPVPDILPSKVNLAINLEPSSSNNLNSRFILQGSMKSLAVQHELKTRIDKEILEKFEWKLRQAINNDGSSIEEFGYANIPITANFYTTEQGFENNERISYAGFYSDCNGIGGEYILTPDSKLLIGFGPQTVMGCSSMREKAEDTLRSLMQHSTSQLTLNLYPSSLSNELQVINLDKQVGSKDDCYMLIQDLQTGEQLIWQSVIKT